MDIILGTAKVFYRDDASEIQYPEALSQTVVVIRLWNSFLLRKPPDRLSRGRDCIKKTHPYPYGNIV